MCKINKKNNSGGFTLLEALVAISILMVAVAAPITIAQKGLSSATYSKNQMIASYLAQDAIEYIINKRDQNVVGKLDWLTGLQDCLPDGNDAQQYCGVDTVAGSNGEGLIQSNGSAYLTKTTADGFYGYTNGQPATNFTRKVSIKPSANGPLKDNNEALITATVNWGAGNEVVVKTLIYNI